jgi:hypothetical protein
MEMAYDLWLRTMIPDEWERQRFIYENEARRELGLPPLPPPLRAECRLMNNLYGKNYCLYRPVRPCDCGLPVRPRPGDLWWDWAVAYALVILLGFYGLISRELVVLIFAMGAFVYGFTRMLWWAYRSTTAPL